MNASCGGDPLTVLRFICLLGFLRFAKPSQSLVHVVLTIAIGMLSWWFVVVAFVCAGIGLGPTVCWRICFGSGPEQNVHLQFIRKVVLRQVVVSLHLHGWLRANVCVIVSVGVFF